MGHSHSTSSPPPGAWHLTALGAFPQPSKGTVGPARAKAFRLLGGRLGAGWSLGVRPPPRPFPWHPDRTWRPCPASVLSSASAVAPGASESKPSPCSAHEARVPGALCPKAPTAPPAPQAWFLLIIQGSTRKCPPQGAHSDPSLPSHDYLKLYSHGVFSHAVVCLHWAPGLTSHSWDPHPEEEGRCQLLVPHRAGTCKGLCDPRGAHLFSWGAHPPISKSPQRISEA